MKDSTIASLAQLQALSQRTESAERQILAHAERLLDACNTELEFVAPKAKMGMPEYEDRYQHLVLERGKLNLIIARARESLGI